MEQADPSYTAKYGFNRQSWRIIAIALVFCAAALLPSVPLWWKIVDVVFFGGGAVLIAALSLRGTTALRVDATGITLCSAPLYPKSTTRTFPWEDIARVIIWPGAFSGRINRLEYVGVERRPGAPPLTGRSVGRRTKSAARLESPGIPAEAAVTRAATNGWVLDHGKLTAAVAHFAPGIPVVDTTASQRPARYRTPK